MEEGLEPPRPQVPGGLLQGGVQEEEPGAHHQGHEGHLEGDVPQDHREEGKPGKAQKLAGEGEEEEEGNPHDHVGHHHGDVEEVAEEAFAGEAVAHEAQGEEGPEDRGDQGGDQGHDQGVGEVLQDPWVLEEALVPLQGEAGEVDPLRLSLKERATTTRMGR